MSVLYRKKDQKWAVHEMLIVIKIHIIFYYFLYFLNHPQWTCIVYVSI